MLYVAAIMITFVISRCSGSHYYSLRNSQYLTLTCSLVKDSVQVKGFSEGEPFKLDDPASSLLSLLLVFPILRSSNYLQKAAYNVVYTPLSFWTVLIVWAASYISTTPQQNSQICLSVYYFVLTRHLVFNGNSISRYINVSVYSAFFTTRGGHKKTNFRLTSSFRTLIITSHCKS